MRLYHGSQVPHTVGHGNRRDRTRRTFLPPPPLPPQSGGNPETGEGEGGTELIMPRKQLLILGITPQIHRSLHQELLLCYRRGLLPRKRPELQCVLERRRREERERRERPLSELDRHMQTRKLRAMELEDERRRRHSEPEFVKVKGALRHIPGVCL